MVQPELAIYYTQKNVSDTPVTERVVAKEIVCWLRILGVEPVQKETWWQNITPNLLQALHSEATKHDFKCRLLKKSTVNKYLLLSFKCKNSANDHLFDSQC